MPAPLGPLPVRMLGPRYTPRIPTAGNLSGEWQERGGGGILGRVWTAHPSDRRSPRQDPGREWACGNQNPEARPRRSAFPSPQVVRGVHSGRVCQLRRRRNRPRIRVGPSDADGLQRKGPADASQSPGPWEGHWDRPLGSAAQWAAGGGVEDHDLGAPVARSWGPVTAVSVVSPTPTRPVHRVLGVLHMVLGVPHRVIGA